VRGAYNLRVTAGNGGAQLAYTVDRLVLFATISTRDGYDAGAIVYDLSVMPARV
jgi:hypothetical protein